MRLHDHLQEAFPSEQLVLAFDSSLPESNYASMVKERVRECDVLLAIIGNDWARTLGRDIVRVAIEEAFEQGKEIIPVLIDEAALPREGDLPKTLHFIRSLHAIRLRNRPFRQGAEALIDMLRRMPILLDFVPHQATSGGLPSEVQDPAIPEQGYGPHFEIGDDGIVTFAPPAALDRQGNNTDRLNKMHPGLRDLSRSLVEALSKGNVPHIHLLERSLAYDQLIDQTLDHIDFSLLYMAGVRLANAERAASGDNDLPSLAAPVRESIDSLLQLHGTFILASRAGLEAIEAGQRYQRGQQEETEYRTAAVDFAQSLQNQPTIIDPKVASVVLDAAAEIGKGANLERSGSIATGIVKNVTVTFATAATLGALSAGALATGSAVLVTVAGAATLVAAEGLKKSKPFAALAALVTRGIDKTTQTELPTALETLRERFKPQLRFFLSAEQHFKRLAGGRDDFKWLANTVRWLEQQAGTQPNPSTNPLPNTDAPKLSRETTLVSNIYLAKVVQVDAALQAAFLDYGGNHRGLLPFDEIHPDYFQLPVTDRQRLIDGSEQAYRAVVLDSDREQDDAIGLASLASPADISPRRTQRTHQYKIEEVIKRRQVMMVQVVRNERGSKGATLSTYLSLVSRYCLLMPNTGSGAGVSVVNISADERLRLKEIVRELEVPEGMGITLRATAVSRTKSEIQQDFNELIKKWETVRDLTLKSAAPTLVYDASPELDGSEI